MAQPPRSKANKPDQTQVFKSAMGATVRAIGGKAELEVTFTSDRPLLTSDKARLANLPRLPTRRDIAIARGQGDAMAMRLASHDPETHRKRSPTSTMAPVRSMVSCSSRGRAALAVRNVAKCTSV